MRKEEKHDSIIGGLFWRFSERICAQAVTFIVSLVIARLLEPKSYGMIAIILVFINLADVFVTGGFGNALIQKKDSDDIDFSSVFYFNIIFSLIIYLIVFISAPKIEVLYGSDYNGLSMALRILAIRIPITAINNVQQAYVSKNMIFRKFFYATLGGTIGAAIIGIVLAYLKMGIWALVAQYLFNAIIDTIVLWVTVRWRPKLVFSFCRLKVLINYGWKLLASYLIDSLYNNLRTLIIGKIYTSYELAFYNRGNQFPSLIIDNVNTTIMSVMFPAISNIQDNYIEIKKLIRKSIIVSSYIILPMMLGLAIIAEPLIKIILTEKWLAAVPYLHIFCIVYVFQPITKANQQVIKALGRSDIFFKLEVLKKAIGLITLILVLKKGVMAIAIGFAITSIISSIIDMYVGGKMISYKMIDQLKAIFPSLVSSIIMGVILQIIGIFVTSSLLCMLVQICLGFIIYIITSIFLKNEGYTILFRQIKLFISKR